MEEFDPDNLSVTTAEIVAQEPKVQRREPEQWQMAEMLDMCMALSSHAFVMGERLTISGSKASFDLFEEPTTVGTGRGFAYAMFNGVDWTMVWSTSKDMDAFWGKCHLRMHLAVVDDLCVDAELTDDDEVVLHLTGTDAVHGTEWHLDLMLGHVGDVAGVGRIYEDGRIVPHIWDSTYRAEETMPSDVEDGKRSVMTYYFENDSEEEEE